MRGLFVACLWLLAVPVLRPAIATPLYSARAGRTCDNCHLTPDDWVNPPLSERKCTLSCAACHVDPGGGGLRNASGRFFGRSTLPMIATAPRPTLDWDRELVPWLYRRDLATAYTDSLPRGPRDFDRSREARWSLDRDRWARGRPLRQGSRWALFPGRYADLRSDPLLRIGWDLRLATLFSAGARFFPMQTDLGIALHPVEHVTLLVNTGARGRIHGTDRTLRDAHTPYLREAFVLLHEAPAIAYLKAGRFTPQFGLRLDDHTAQTRRTFELDGALPQTRVTGVEIGVHPNYPYAALAWFRGTSRGRPPAAADVFDVDDGWGTTLHLGYRDEAWSAGASALVLRRPNPNGGDAESLALHGSLNPAVRWRRVPLTYQWEIDVGRWTRDSGHSTRRTALYHELDWLVANGVNVLLAQDWADTDTQVRNDHSQRLTLGLQVTPVPGLTLDARGRVLFPAAELSGADAFVQLHVWN